MEKLGDLGGAILSFSSLEDLSNWLAEFNGEYLVERREIDY